VAMREGGVGVARASPRWPLPGILRVSAGKGRLVMRHELVRVLWVSLVLGLLGATAACAATTYVEIRGPRALWATVELLRDGQSYRRERVRLQPSDRGYSARISWEAPPRARYDAVMTCDEPGVVVRHTEGATFLHPWQYGRAALKCGDFELIEAQPVDVKGAERKKP